ncbi:alpha/beta fold hydrolase [Streptomyces huiliensis]|uniref:alpha/beta fold hydrolase n=1 Tax=Streptomyces huiliensis TaxID=2876027 RepID=UPI001CBCFC0A|nr:alpha/beta hydrolase [Streptomyces huiliensis]
MGAFTGDEARTRFLAAYDRAMAHWPEPREERDVPTAFGTTRVHVYGKGDATPVVLLPGRNATPAVWSANVAALGAARPVLAVDVVGEPGRSPQTAPLRTPEAMAAWLEEVLDGLGLERTHLLGMSYGGWAAANHATRAPGRIASLTLLDPARTLAPLRPGFVTGAVLAVLSRSEERRRRYFGRVIGDCGAGAEAAEAQLRVLLEALDGFRGRLPQPRKLTDDELRSITVPALVLLGGDSLAADAHRAAARTRLLPDARVRIVPGAGHTIPAAELNSRVPEFLAEVDRSRA